MGIQIVNLRFYSRSAQLLSIKSIPLNRILIGKALGSGKLIQTVIRLRCHHIMLNLDNFSVCRTNQCSCMVTVTEIITFLSGSFFYQILTNNRLGIHSYQRHHTVATMNIKCLRHRTKTVSSIHITTMFLVVIQTPSQFIILTVLPIMIPERAQFMDVSTLSANHFTKYSLLCHVQRIHFKPVITTVFQYHTMFASLFTHVDQVPTLLKIHSRRNFYSYMFAVLHSAHCYREVMQPIGSNINQVYVIAFTKFFVSFLSGINSCLRQRCFLQILLAALST